MLVHPVGEMDKTLCQEGPHTSVRRIERSTLIGPILDLLIFHVGNDSGIDVQNHNTSLGGAKLRVNACTKAVQNCRLVHDRDDVTVDQS